MIAISVQQISKQFQLYSPRVKHRTLADRLYRRSSGQPDARTFHALRDVSFDVAPGEVIGLIGRNGAGKSTLLKILSRIIRPTSGRIELNGRVGSLLEVGAGFHEDLTGRENIYLNAAILGMSYAEVSRKLDEIVAFSGVEEHLDEPVKHYSSGMYMRLAFAIAAHIEPEILLLDEVLAVGDAEFQKRCVERIEKVGRGGQAVVLVSHSIQTVLRLCQRAVLLDRGQVVAVGRAPDVVARYLEVDGDKRGERRYAEGPHAPGDGVVRLRSVRVRDRSGQTLDTVDIGAEIGLEIEFEVLESGKDLFPILTLDNDRDAMLWVTDSGTEWHGIRRPCGLYRQTAWLPPHLLGSGMIQLSVAIESGNPHTVHVMERDAVTIPVMEAEGGARGNYPGTIVPGIRPRLEWSVEHRGADSSTA